MKIEMTKARIMAASRMWKEDIPVSVIAERFGVSKGKIKALAIKRRDLFPRLKVKSDRVYAVKSERSYHPDRVTRITREGVSITMPRVTFIDGPAP